MKKRWVMFWLAEAAAGILYIFLILLFPSSAATGGGALALLSVLWLVYYYKLEYDCTDGMIHATSGIIFRRRRTLQPQNILWEQQLCSPLFRGAALTILHTSGGRVVIMGQRFPQKQ